MAVKEAAGRVFDCHTLCSIAENALTSPLAAEVEPAGNAVVAWSQPAAEGIRILANRFESARSAPHERAGSAPTLSTSSPTTENHASSSVAVGASS